MATQTSLVAQQVRLRQWSEQIRECQNRPEGMDVQTWCTQNNITKANYYLFFVKYFSLKKASKFPVFVKGFFLLLAGIDYASRRMRACSIR